MADELCDSADLVDYFYVVDSSSSSVLEEDFYFDVGYSFVGMAFDFGEFFYDDRASEDEVCDDGYYDDCDDEGKCTVVSYYGYFY